MIVEDGSGLTNSDSYATVAEVDAYLANRGRSEENKWSDFSDEEKSFYIVSATDYVESQYSASFIGRKSNRGQALSWPRFEAYDRDEFLIEGIPNDLKYGVAEYAVRASKTSLLPDVDESTRRIKMEKKKVSTLEKEIHYITAPSSKVAIGSRYPAADAYLNKLTGGKRYSMSRA